MMSIALCVLLGGVAAAQNLVPNPSFEEYTQCPNAFAQIDSATGWWSFGGTPDLYNTCDPDTMSVPYNVVGFQWPSDGVGYAAMSFYPQVETEFMQAELSEPLEVGLTTYVSMRVSPGGFGYPDWTSPRYASSHIGLRFSTQPTPLIVFPWQFYYNAAALYMTEVLSDTSTWTVLSMSFAPDSAYRYVQIGNFFQDQFCSTVVLDPSGPWDAAYAFIDEVCVSYNPADCGMTSGISVAPQRTFTVTNPFQDQLQIRLPRAAAALRARVMDAAGRIVIDHVVPAAGREITLATNALNAGAYVVCLSDQEGEYRPVKVFRVEE